MLHQANYCESWLAISPCLSMSQSSRSSTADQRPRRYLSSSSQAHANALSVILLHAKCQMLIGEAEWMPLYFSMRPRPRSTAVSNESDVKTDSWLPLETAWPLRHGYPKQYNRSRVAAHWQSVAKWIPLTHVAGRFSDSLARLGAYFHF